MNIIQAQEKLKNLPVETILGYIQNPTGEIPTYLAIAELERQKVMREKYAAQQTEKPSITEQIVSESMTEIMPRPMDMVGGLGQSNRQEALRRETASPMAQGIATPMAPPMAPQEAGIAANPAPNVGQNYNAGGIVSYAVGGDVYRNTPGSYTAYEDELLKDYRAADDDEFLKDFDFEKALLDTSVNRDDYNNPYAAMGDLQRPDYSEPANTEGIRYLTEFEQMKADRAALNDVYGIDNSYYDDLKGDLEAERAEYAGDKDQAINMALINAGLGIASGTSQNALENIAQGSKAGIESFVGDMKDIRKDERAYKKDLRGLQGMQRAENIADRTRYEEMQDAIAVAGAKAGIDANESATIWQGAQNLAFKEQGEITGGNLDGIWKEYAEREFGRQDSYTDTQLEEIRIGALDARTQQIFNNSLNARRSASPTSKSIMNRYLGSTQG
jgi:hypothetical protein